MKTSVTTIVLIALCATLLCSCTRSTQAPTYKKEVQLGRAIEFRPIRISRGDLADHACIRGDYMHVYETESGWSSSPGRPEVWLCCVPIDALLSDQFHCADTLLTSILTSIYGGDSDYLKVRFCSLLHPTEIEPVYIRVCIPAPLVAPVDMNLP